MQVGAGVNGNAVEIYEYEVYGYMVIRDQSCQPRDASRFGNPYLFTGRRFDTETGLYYYRARMYSANIGRFLSAKMSKNSIILLGKAHKKEHSFPIADAQSDKEVSQFVRILNHLFIGTPP